MIGAGIKSSQNILKQKCSTESYRRCYSWGFFPKVFLGVGVDLLGCISFEADASVARLLLGPPVTSFEGARSSSGTQPFLFVEVRNASL
jgi:hypothetical protein